MGPICYMTSSYFYPRLLIERIHVAGLLSVGLLFLEAAHGAVVQTNFGTGDKTEPGPPISTTDLLQTSLSSASRTGAPGSDDLYFYREDSGYTVDLSRLYDGVFGLSGTESAYTVMPNQTTLTFNLNTTSNPGGYTLTSIVTYAGWDDGRDGQRYTVEYSTILDPDTFIPLVTIDRFDNTDFPLTKTYWDYNLRENIEVPNRDYSATAVQLTSSGSDPLAENVAVIRFVFNGVENGGTAYREFDVMGYTTVPEPSASVAAAALGMAALFTRRRKGA
jgi:hypothetical protein